MIIIKTGILFAIIIGSSFLGFALSNKYKDRVKDLKQVKSALNMLKTKILYTYEPLPDIFFEIGNKFEGRNSEIFLR